MTEALVAVPGRMPEQLAEYWVHGKGALKIRWGTDGDFNRCVRHLRKYFRRNPEGLCNRLHTRALGKPPGQHALAADAGIVIDDDYEDPEWLEVMASLPRKKMWRGRLAPIDVATGDRRRFDRGALTRRDLPLPLMYQLQTSEGHQQSVVVGRILDVEIGDDDVMGYGDWLDTEHTAAAQQRLEAGLGGVSVDLDDVEMEVRVPGTAKLWLEAEQCDLTAGKCGPHESVVTKGRLSGATIVPIPAFAEARIELYDGLDEEAVLAAFEAEGYEPEADACGCGMSASAIAEYCTPLVASAPVAFTPPLAAFERPELERLCGLRMDQDRFPGFTYVYGYVAPWELPHMGQLGRKAPRSRSGYSYFHLNPVYTAEGEEILVGKITFGGAHPSLEEGLVAAMHHYSVATQAVAVVRAGEDERGIWFAGVLLPHVDEQTKTLLSVSPLSGDWRPVGSRTNLEMIAALAVNVPGFPIVMERMEQGKRVALIASAGSGELTPEEELEVLLKHEVSRRVAAARIQAEFAQAAAEEIERRQALLDAFQADPDEGHDGCEEDVYCRNPLHPGPCRGMKRPGSAPKVERGDAREDRHGGWDPVKKRYLKPSGNGYMPEGWKPGQGRQGRRRRLHTDEDVRRRVAEK